MGKAGKQSLGKHVFDFWLCIQIWFWGIHWECSHINYTLPRGIYNLKLIWHFQLKMVKPCFTFTLISHLWFSIVHLLKILMKFTKLEGQNLCDLKISKKGQPCPGPVTQLVGASCHAPKGCRFDPQSGHIPRLRVRSLVEMCTGGNQLILLSLSLSLCLNSIKTYPPIGIKKKDNQN